MAEELWSSLDVQQTDEELSDVLRQLVHVHSDHASNDFPSEAIAKVLQLLRDSHDPHVWLQACVLLYRMCVSVPPQFEPVRCGALTCLANLLDESFSSLAVAAASSEEQEVSVELVKFVMCLFQFFACGPPVCVHKLLQPHVFQTLLSAVDSTTSALYGCGTADTKTLLESLVAGRRLVGRRVRSPIPFADAVFKRLLGSDLTTFAGDDLAFGDSFVVDLYNGDTAVRITEQLMAEGGDGTGWISGSESLDADADGVEVFILSVLDSAHFVAVFGPDQLELFRQCCQTVEEAVAGHSSSMSDLPSPGQQVYVSHPGLGSFRAFVVKADVRGSILTYAPDCGYVEEVPLSCLRKLDDNYSVPLLERPLIHVCKLFGQ